MRMKRFILSVLMCCTGCGPGDVITEAELGECVDRVDGTIQTCEAICEDQGSVCVERACDGATYVLGALPEVCSDPGGGGSFDTECESAIDWGFGNRVLCCCEVQP
jgi:hypothetical protein